MKPISLIIPPSAFLLDDRVFMTLGILKVAAALEKAGYRVEMLDLSGVQNFEEAVKAHAVNSESKVFGLTATTPQMPAATKILNALREVRPDSKVILGGPHVTLTNAAVKGERKKGIEGRATKSLRLLESQYNTLVFGDGENAILDAISENAPKWIDADDPTNPLFLTNQTLNETPFPARHLIDVPSYHYSIDGVPAISMIAQLGCPFECGFCGGRESPMLRRVRMRSTENVVAEIESIYKDYGFRGFQLYDDELNVNRQMVGLMNAITDLQNRLGVEFRLRGFVKSQLFNDEQAAAMYRAGFRWLLTGFESGSPRILENINKKATRDENTRCLEIAKKHNLKVKALMSIGHPGESGETVLDTKKWLLETKPDDFDVTIITTYPGTPYADRAIETKPGIWTYTYPKTGDRLHSIEIDHTVTADFYKGDPNGGYVSYVYTDYISAENLVKLRDETELEVRRVLKIPFNAANPGKRFEASMGMMPGYILRRSGDKSKSIQ